MEFRVEFSKKIQVVFIEIRIWEIMDWMEIKELGT